MGANVGYALRHLQKDDDNRLQGRQLRMNETLKIDARDFLDQSFSQPSNIDESRELNLDLHVPLGWQKHLNLKSGKVYLQKCSSQMSKSTTKPPQDTNCPIIKSPLNVIEDTDLELRLAAYSELTTYQSVCTLDDVKSALERAKNMEPRRMCFPYTGSSKLPSSSSTSTKVTVEAGETMRDMIISPEPQLEKVLLSAAGCPNCLLYVMISKDNPKCPKCFSTVSLPVMKKPRIDLTLRI